MIVAASPRGYKEDEYRAYCAAVARTCKSFYEPAANALWRDLVDIAPLVRTLPQYTWSTSQTGSIVRPNISSPGPVRHLTHMMSRNFFVLLQQMNGDAF